MGRPGTVKDAVKDDARPFRHALPGRPMQMRSAGRGHRGHREGSSHSAPLGSEKQAGRSGGQRAGSKAMRLSYVFGARRHRWEGRGWGLQRATRMQRKGGEGQDTPRGRQTGRRVHYRIGGRFAQAGSSIGRQRVARSNEPRTLHAHSSAGRFLERARMQGRGQRGLPALAPAA